MRSQAMTEVWQKTMNLIKPPPHLKISQWADKFRFLSTESSSEAGKFETSRAIFQKEIMNSKAMIIPGVSSSILYLYQCT